MDDDGHSQYKISRINVRLLRERIKHPNDALDPKRRKDLTELTPVTESPPSWWFVHEAEREPQPWVAFANSHVKERVEATTAVSQSALLFIKVDNRIFVLTFGASARFFLNSDAIETSFPFDVVNRVLDPESVNNVESCYLETNSLRTKKQIPLGTSIGRFGLDTTRDNVRSLSGKAKDERFGKRLHGAQSLVASQSATLEDVVRLCRKWLKVYKDKAGAHPEIWSNFVEPIVDPEVIEKLSAQLIKKIQLGQSANIVIGIPEIYDVVLVEGFKFSPAPDSEYGFDLSFQVYIQRYRSAQLCTVEVLKSDQIQAKSAEDGRIAGRWPLWDCLEVELSQGGNTYLLHSGRWHQVPTSIVQRLNQEIDNIQAAAINMPVAWGKEKEGDYNQRAGEAAALTLMDCKIIRGPGYETGIEVCDLLAVDKAMFIHIKRGTDSASLSHLFRQGITSARSFVIEKDLQEKLKGHLRSKHDQFSVEKFMSRRDHKVVFGIMTPKSGRWSEILPFFSKMSLYDAVRELRAMRFEVQLLRIEQRDGTAQKIKVRRSAQPEVS